VQGFDASGHSTVNSHRSKITRAFQWSINTRA
jgi:hypothetical protein